jgi:hypothetical protein
MEALEPAIQVLTVFTVLSVLAERMTNLLKLRSEELRVKLKDKEQEKAREVGISWRSALIGVFVALLLKANFFEIVGAVEDPWKTLGWVQAHGPKWTRAAVLGSASSTLYALGGCVITGIGLGFGSKFWHDVLGAVYEVRELARGRKEKLEKDAA